MAAIRLSCKGCRKTTRADIDDDPLRAYQLVGWKQDIDGDWCVICQEKRTGDSNLARAVRARAGVIGNEDLVARRTEYELVTTQRPEIPVLVTFVLWWIALSGLFAAVVLVVLSLLDVR